MKIKITIYILFIMFFVSCDSETSGEKILYNTGVKAVFNSDSGSFENSREWKISLTKAYMVAGPIYFYSKESAVVKCPAEAQADKGAFVGEVTSQYVVNLLGEDFTQTGEAEGEAGMCRRADFYIYPPKDSSLSQGSDNESFEKLNGNSIYIEGVAVKDDVEKAFIVDLTIPDEGTMRIVQNISPDSEIELSNEKEGLLLLEVLVENWFVNVDFDSLVTEKDNSSLFSENEDSQAYTAFMTGIKSYRSYTIKWSD